MFVCARARGYDLRIIQRLMNHYFICYQKKPTANRNEFLPILGDQIFWLLIFFFFMFCLHICAVWIIFTVKWSPREILILISRNNILERKKIKPFCQTTHNITTTNSSNWKYIEFKINDATYHIECKYANWHFLLSKYFISNLSNKLLVFSNTTNTNLNSIS